MRVIRQKVLRKEGGIDMTYGLYLCKVQGMKFCDYIVLKYNEYGWWRYFQDYVHQLEGWVGNDLEIVEVVQLIKELEEE